MEPEDASLGRKVHLELRLFQERRPLPKHGDPLTTRPFEPTSGQVLRPSPMRSSPDVAIEAARARVTALEATISQCPRQCRRGSFEVVAGNFTEGQTVCPRSTSWRKIGRVPPNHRTCQETSRQSRQEFVEAADRARKPDSKRYVRKQEQRQGCRFRIAEDAGGDRRPSSRQIRVDGRTPKGNQDSHGFGDVGGHTVGTHGNADRRCRQQRPGPGTKKTHRDKKNGNGTKKANTRAPWQLHATQPDNLLLVALRSSNSSRPTARSEESDP